MTTRVFTDPRPQTFSPGNTTNSNGKIYFREPGNGSTTLKDVYADKDLATPYINPVILDANGRAPTIFLNGDYNVQMTDANDVQIWRVDNYQPATVDGQFDEWDTTLTYAVNDYVRYSNGKYYVSLQSGNTGNVPSSSPLWWSEAFFLTVYNSSTTYASGDVVYYDGNLYTSLAGSNTGNTPDTSYTFWARPGVSVPVISGYTGDIIDYRVSGTGSVLDVIANISKALSVTVGPTGSGAQYIWTALDDLPSNSVSVQLAFESVVTKTTGTSALYTMQCNLGGLNTTKLVRIQDYGSSTEPSSDAIVGQASHTLDANNTFSVFWNSTSTDSETLLLTLIGFSVAEA